MRRLSVLALFAVLLPACPARTTGQEVARAEPGTYTYEFSGRSLDPRNRTTVLNSLEDVEVVEELSRDGDDYVTEITNQANPEIVTRLHSRWEEDGLVLVSSETQTPDGSSTCSFEPPVTVVPDPLEEGRLPRQTWEGSQCRGTVDVAVREQETVADASGRRWETRRIEVRTRTTTTGASTDERETRWFSPELGKDVRTSRVAEGIRDDRRFYNETDTLLTSHP